MRRRALGKTGMEVSELALGTWGLSGEACGPVKESEQDRVIDRAIALGIDLFETADSYGHGAMEEKLGARLPKDGSVRVVTKIGTDRTSLPPRKRFDAEHLRTSAEKSCERLNVDAIDVLLLHNPAEKTLENDEATGVLAQLCEVGVAKAWGVAAGSAEIARAAVARGAQVISVAYNAFFAKELHELHDLIEESGVGVLARSILAHGLLAGYWSMQKEFADGDHRNERWTPDELRRRVHQLSALRVLIGGTVYTMRSGALRYVLTNEDVSAAILGPRNAVQLDQLVREAGGGPPYLHETRLEKLAARLQDVGANT